MLGDQGQGQSMIGAAGVSAVPMAARVVHKEGVEKIQQTFAHARDGS